MSRKRASRGRRAGIVGYPICNFPSSRGLLDILGRDDAPAPIFFGRDAGAVNTRAETSRCDFVDPGIEICFLLRQHPAPFLLIEKDQSAGRKTLSLSVC